MRTPVFYLLAAAFTFNALVFSAMTIHLLAMIIAKGLTAAQAAALGALIGPMQVAGTPGRDDLRPARFAGHASALIAMRAAAGVDPAAGDRRNRRRRTSSLFALLFGAGNGVMTIVRGTIPVEFFGRDHYGAVNGALAAPVLIAKAVGPLVAAVRLGLDARLRRVALMLAAVALCSLAFLALAMRWRRAECCGRRVARRRRMSQSRPG